jgi:hypothetical protein
MNDIQIDPEISVTSDDPVKCVAKSLAAHAGRDFSVTHYGTLDVQAYIDSIKEVILSAAYEMVDEGIIFEDQLQLVRNYIVEQVNVAVDLTIK